MLERVPRTRAVLFEPKHCNHMQMLYAAIGAQRPVVETIRNEIKSENGTHFSPVFSAHERELVLPPGFPCNGILAFARQIAAAWNESTNEERKKAGLMSAFTSKNTTAFSFFGRNMETVISVAVRLAARMRRLEILEKMMKGEMELGVGQTQLRQGDEKFRGARLETPGAVYVSGEITENIPDLSQEIGATSALLSLRVRNIGRRLSVGYSPII